jgi:hypothetical protein
MVNLLKMFYSFYSCELWFLNSRTNGDFCIAWGKALRHVVNLPHNLTLTNTLFKQRYRASLNDLELNSAISLLEVMFVRERHFTFPELFDLSHAQ